MNRMKQYFQLILMMVLMMCFSLETMAQQRGQFRVLIFSKTQGFRHQAIPEAAAAIKRLSKEHLFDVYVSEDANLINDENLAKYDVLVMNNTTGTIFNEEQRAAFQRFVQSGKGVVGIHSATDTEYDWEWYNKMIGAQFKNHPHNQTLKLDVVNRNHPATYHLPEKWIWTDELYAFKNFNQEVTVLITADERTYDAKDGMGDFHPMAWYHEFDGGRVFYTALGHLESTYEDKDFLKHLYGGIWWAAKGFPID
ncbi:ThuA domain-containing protein [Cecembia sp.]|uniref:ThuA domain-containing protein n=1 Tax=Cecembia sp. TaxID=1898110 RepID=UPI0025C15C11|nr:ThuA domain-containing protein [Cecembia sp.]